MLAPISGSWREDVRQQSTARSEAFRGNTTMSSCNESAGDQSCRGWSVIPMPHEPAGVSAIDLAGVGRIGAAIASALQRLMDSRGLERLEREGAGWWQRAARELPAGVAAGDRAGADLRFLFISATEPGALELAERASAAVRAGGARVVAIVMYPPLPDRAAVQNATAKLAAEVDAIVVMPDYPHLTLLDCIVRAYRAAVGERPTRASASAMPAGSEFLDLRSAFHGAGRASLGSGLASGPERILEAATDAVDELGDIALRAASGILVIVAGAETLRLAEVASALYQVHARTRGDAQAVLAAHYDERMGHAVRVIVVAAS
ncbi:cell division protein FtsZ [Burkholderia gladioli]|uniref:cell division protein FtsZ n=1 Tax=Burkholderia gladioli TaxID=28095 RepID=UPI00164175FD|nr:cell division protein FtsZ [Burkholderia gladioli]